MYAIFVELSPIPFFSLKKTLFRLVISMCYSQGQPLIALGDMSKKYYNKSEDLDQWHGKLSCKHLRCVLFGIMNFVKNQPMVNNMLF